MKKTIKKINWILVNQFGLDARKFFYSSLGIPKYIKDLINFKRNYLGKIEFQPCLNDWYEEGGITKTEYFWQDLIFAQQIFSDNPIKHVDVGSRVDGFVAHVASFRQVEVFDIRSITSNIPNITFRQSDLMKESDDYSEYCDSLSCLHALEHFGLGRYGDKIDENGYILGLKNISRIIKKNGLFYLSIPIGQSKVVFNAHRVFNPIAINTILNDLGFRLVEFSWYSDKKLTKSSDMMSDLIKLSDLDYSLGMFTFRKS